MTAYLDGRIDNLHDGVTHQAWDWTNRDIVEVVKEIWPSRYFINCEFRLPSSEHGSCVREKIAEYGRVLETETADVDRSRSAPSRDQIDEAGPSERFNAPYRSDPHAQQRPVVTERLALLRDAIAEEKKPKVDYYAKFERRENILNVVKPVLIVLLVFAVLVWLRM